MYDTEDYPAGIDYPQLLHQTYREALERNENAQKHWQKVKEDYKSLESLLRELPNELSKDVMVPVAPRALMHGKIVHSNEILVCLGQGYFIKRSATQAAAICQRREKICYDMLQSLEREHELFVGRSSLPVQQEAFNGEREIIEEYNEEKESQWQVEHKQKEKEYRQRLAELKEKERIAVTDEESLWRRLDELELQEELEEELDRLHTDGNNDDEEEVDDDDDDDDDGDNGNGKCDVEEATGKERNQYTEKGDTLNVEKDIATSRSMHGRRVSFVGLQENGQGCNGDGEEKELKIMFRHSSNAAQATTEPKEISSIHSPAELYSYFKDLFLIKRKSILKKTSSYENELEHAQSVRIYEELPNEQSEEFENICDLPTSPPPVLEEIVERNIAPSATLSTADRHVSRFKAMRQLKKS